MQREPQASGHIVPKRCIAASEPATPRAASCGPQQATAGGGQLELTTRFPPPRPSHRRGPQAGTACRCRARPGAPVSGQPPLSWPSTLSPGTAARPSSSQYSGNPLGALTLEAGPLPGVPVPAPLHEAQEALAGARPGSADRRQLGAVALHHLHHDVQDVFLICKGKVHKSGQLVGLRQDSLSSGGATTVGEFGACHHHPPRRHCISFAKHRAFFNP